MVRLHWCYWGLVFLGLLCGSRPSALAVDGEGWKSRVVRFDRPAEWKEMRPQGGTGDHSWARDATPIGNGRLGALIYGGVEKDHLELTEISLWSGGTCSDETKEKGPDAVKFGSFQPFGTLEVEYPCSGDAKGYERLLDTGNATAAVRYEVGGVGYERQYFASEPHQVLVMNLHADAPGKLDAVFRLRTLHSKDRIVSERCDGGAQIVLQGRLKNGMNYEGRVLILPEGGKVRVGPGGSVTLEKANGCRVLVAMATDYALDAARRWKGESPQKRNDAVLAAVRKLPAARVGQDHRESYARLFNRVLLDLGETPDALAKLPIGMRLKRYRQTPAQTASPDPDLEELIFNFGRYVAISCSRPGNLPANLQGLWNYSLIPPWDADYHNNINIQMCYWGVEPANLPECALPLIDFIREMAPVARKITQESGAFRTPSGRPVSGWTCRTAQNIFGGQGFKWNKPASAWYALHLWEHYRFTADKAYLRRTAYPLMKEICRFWEGQLKPLRKAGANFKTADNRVTPETIARDLKDIPEGALVAPMGWSPEHGPREDGCAHDQQIVWELFNATVEAAGILREDADWSRQLAQERDRLVGPRIGAEGLLLEWMIDRPSGAAWDPHHRHTSHLFAVYPGSQINPVLTPEWAAAARKSLLARGIAGDSRRSWTWPWRACLWARLLEGEQAYEMLRGLIQYNMLDSLLTTHPPMQVDGTLGIVAAYAEMLLQSHAGTLHLLPAVPKAWKNGSVRGLKARGNIMVDITWQQGRVTQYRLMSPIGQKVRTRVNGRVKQWELKPGVAVEGN